MLERPVRMAPKRKRGASEQLGWPKAAEAAAAAARAAAVRAGDASYTFEWTDGGSKKTKTMFIVDAAAPKEYPRVVVQNTEAREGLRPSKLQTNIPGPDWCPSLGQCSRLEGFDSPRCLAFGLFLFGILVGNGMRSPIELALPCIPSSAVRMPLSLLLPL